MEQPALKTLREQRLNWKARRAAKKSLFSSPTPMASRLLLVSRVRQWVARLTIALNLLILLHFLWVLGGLGAQLPFVRFLDHLLLPMLAPFEGWFPPIRVGPVQRLEPSHVLLMTLIFAIGKGLSRGLARLLWGKGVNPDPFPLLPPTP